MNAISLENKLTQIPIGFQLFATKELKKELITYNCLLDPKYIYM